MKQKSNFAFIKGDEVKLLGCAIREAGGGRGGEPPKVYKIQQIKKVATMLVSSFAPFSNNHNV